MGFRDSLRQLACGVRAIPGMLEARPYSVAVAVSTWSGTEIGQGSETITTTNVVEAGGYPPKVRWLTDEELSLGGWADGTVQVGPITPDHTGGGTLLSAIRPSPVNNAEAYVLLTGPAHPTGGRYRVRKVEHHRPHQYLVIAERAAD